MLAVGVLLAAARAAAPAPTAHGVAVTVGGTRVELEVAGTGAFRVGVARGGAAGPVASPMLAPFASYAQFSVTHPAGGVGLKADFGEVSIDTTSGAFTLTDAGGKTLVSSPALFPGAGPASCASKGDTDIVDGARVSGCEDIGKACLSDCSQQQCCDGCTAKSDCTSWIYSPTQRNCWWVKNATGTKSFSDRVVGGDIINCAGKTDTDVTGGTRVSGCEDKPACLSDCTQQQCCDGCTAKNNCTTWIYSPGQKNCWWMRTASGTKPFGDRVAGGDAVTDQIQLALGRASSGGALYYGAGYGGSDGHTLTSTGAQAGVENTEFYAPHYWSTDGYSAFTVGAVPYNPSAHNQYTVSWQSQSQGTTWSVVGDRADVYLTPAVDLKAAQRGLWRLTGAPPVPPRYAFGFIACQWGWKNRQDIDDKLHTFRNGSFGGPFPIDAWISDFEWYTDTPDYTVPDEGKPGYTDFGYNPTNFPEPVAQLKEYHDELKMRFGGIRKPRLGNPDLLTMAKSKGWLISVGGGGAAGGNRNLNYSIPAVRDWYQGEMLQYLKDGVDFWWNDEGESTFFTTHWWNLAEADLLANFSQGRRFWTINRDFTPGMQRLGAAVWTGDQRSSWDALANHPYYLLAWQQAGAGYVTSDTGGFSGDETPELLVRWYQFSLFSSHMRVHSTIGATPHFPWLWGDEAAAAMRKAMELRYRLVPYLYSLAHAQYTDLEPIFRPMAYYWADDAKAASVGDQWLVGGGLLVAPVLAQGGARSVYLPAGTWHAFGGGAAAVAGPATLSVSAALDAVPAYAPAGSVVPLAPVVQYTDLLPGGALEVRVYAGADGGFTLTEDDGETTAYETGAARRTAFSWSDASRTLTWATSGSFSDAHTFTQLRAVLYASDGSNKTSAVSAIGAGGKITF